MQKRILFSASLFHSLNDAATVTVPMIFPVLYNQQYIIKTYTHIGILSYVGFLTTFVFQVITAHLSDRFEYKHLLLFSVSGICLSLVSITFTSAFATFLILYLVFRAFTSFYHPVGISWVSRMHPQQRIDSAMGIQSGSGNLGVLIAFISVGWLSQSSPWQLPLFIWAAAGFFLGAVSYVSVRNTTTRDTTSFSRLDFSSWALTLKRIGVYIPAFIFGGASWGTTIYYAPSLLNHRFGIPMGQTGLYLGFWIGLGTVTNYFFGFLSRKCGRFNLSLTGLIFASLFVFLLGVVTDTTLAVVCLLCFGTFLFLTYPAFNSFVGNAVPSRNQPQAFSLTANIQVLTGAVVNLAAGFLSDRFGINTPFLLVGILGIFIIFFYVSKWSELKSSNSMGEEETWKINVDSGL